MGKILNKRYIILEDLIKNPFLDFSRLPWYLWKRCAVPASPLWCSEKNWQENSGWKSESRINKRPRKKERKEATEIGRELERDEGGRKPATSSLSLKFSSLIAYFVLWKQFEQSGSLRSSYGFPIFWQNEHKQSAHFSDSLIRNRENGLGGTANRFVPCFNRCTLFA